MSRETILKAIRQNKPEIKPLTDYSGDTAPDTGTETKRAFMECLIRVGSEVTELDDKNAVSAFIGEHFNEAVDFENPASWNEFPSGCPKSRLDKIGTAVLTGQFGVAENGAVWLDESNFPNRLIPFIAEQLVIKLKKEDLVRDMHEAYRRIDPESTGFGVFISGPSKTADIEQSLVYGAHGAKKLWVILY